MLSLSSKFSPLIIHYDECLRSKSHLCCLCIIGTGRFDCFLVTVIFWLLLFFGYCYFLFVFRERRDLLGLQVSVHRAVPVQVALSSGQLEFVFRLTRVCLAVE